MLFDSSAVHPAGPHRMRLSLIRYGCRLLAAAGLSLMAVPYAAFSAECTYAIPGTSWYFAPDESFKWAAVVPGKSPVPCSVKTNGDMINSLRHTVIYTCGDFKLVNTLPGLKENIKSILAGRGNLPYTYTIIDRYGARFIIPPDRVKLSTHHESYSSDCNRTTEITKQTYVLNGRTVVVLTKLVPLVRIEKAMPKL